MIRKATLEDSERIKNFCYANNKRLPSENGINLLIEQGDEIKGFVHVGVKTFIDPMVVSDCLGKIESVKIIDELMTAVRGVCIGSGVEDVYFTAEGQGFISFLEKKFDVEKYTDEHLFHSKV